MPRDIVTLDTARKARALRRDGIEWSDIANRLGRHSVRALQASLRTLAVVEETTPRETKGRASNGAA